MNTYGLRERWRRACEAAVRARRVMRAWTWVKVSESIKAGWAGASYMTHLSLGFQRAMASWCRGVSDQQVNFEAVAEQPLRVRSPAGPARPTAPSPSARHGVTHLR